MLRDMPHKIHHLALIAGLTVMVGLAYLEITSGGSTMASDVTAQVERIGNPFNKGPYARNVWDMQLFGGRIYLGHGNSSNEGPEINAGPVPVIYYDPASSEFVEQYMTDEEQIDLYRILNGQLYIPGHDPRGSPANGNLYRLSRTGWTKLPTVPGAVHVYDLAQHEGKLFAATGSATNQGISMSSDGGMTWQTVLPTNLRVYNLFTLKGRLYAVVRIDPSSDPMWTSVHVFDGSRFAKLDLPGARITPNLQTPGLVRLVRHQEFAGQQLYIAASMVNDHQWAPLAFYVAPALDQARNVSLPDSEALPYDVLVRDRTVYVLAAARQPSGKYTVLVYASTDLNTWREVFRFSAETFARSFEEHNGDFYFGLGCNTDSLSPATGDILRVRWRPAAPAAPTPTWPRENGQRRVHLPLLRSDGRRGTQTDTGDTQGAASL